MTKEEELDWLYRLKSEICVCMPKEWKNMSNALNMAIKALEQQKPMENFESVKDHILKLASDYKCWDNRLTHDEALELCHTLEQKPSEDAVSRKAVLNKIKEVCFSEEWLQFRVDNGSNGQRDFLINYIEQLPPVTPTKCIATVKFSKEDMQELIDEKMKDIVVERKKGKWIDTDVTLLNRQGYIVHEVICSECNGISYFRKMGNKYIGANLCPNCGCKMSEGGK